MKSPALLRALRILALVALLWAASAGASTFGYTGSPATNAVIEGSIHGYYATPSTTGTITKITFLFGSASCVLETGGNLKGALYQGNPLSGSLTLIAETSERNTVCTESGTWLDLTFTTTPTITCGTKYMIAVWSAGISVDEHDWRQETNTGDTISTRAVTYGAWPNPLDSYGTTAARRAGIYVTYTQTDGCVATMPKRRRRNMRPTVWDVPTERQVYPEYDFWRKESRATFAGGVGDNE